MCRKLVYPCWEKEVSMLHVKTCFKKYVSPDSRPGCWLPGLTQVLVLWFIILTEYLFMKHKVLFYGRNNFDLMTCLRGWVLRQICRNSAGGEEPKPSPCVQTTSELQQCRLQHQPGHGGDSGEVVFAPVQLHTSRSSMSACQQSAHVALAILQKMARHY